MSTITKKATKSSIIGDVIRDIPGAESVIKKYLGDGCFTCPGINVEELSFGAMMHNVDPDTLVEEINAAAEAEAQKAGGQDGE